MPGSTKPTQPATCIPARAALFTGLSQQPTTRPVGYLDGGCRGTVRVYVVSPSVSALRPPGLGVRAVSLPGHARVAGGGLDRPAGGAGELEVAGGIRSPVRPAHAAADPRRLLRPHAHIDQQLSRLFHELRSLGVAGNIVACLISDHGEMMGDHYMCRKNCPYQGSVRVPFIYVTDGQKICIWCSGTGVEQLFDLASDPHRAA